MVVVKSEEEKEEGKKERKKYRKKEKKGRKEQGCTAYLMTMDVLITIAILATIKI